MVAQTFVVGDFSKLLLEALTAVWIHRMTSRFAKGSKGYSRSENFLAAAFCAGTDSLYASFGRSTVSEFELLREFAKSRRSL